MCIRDSPLNSSLADEMGIIIGTSHHEPMARNHQEYARNRKEYGAWNYQTNKEGIDRFFREGIQRMKGKEEDVYKRQPINHGCFIKNKLLIHSGQTSYLQYINLLFIKSNL